MDKVILTTGGTGGHIFPALAVAAEIRRRRPDTEILFIGSNYGPERELAQKAGLPFVGLSVRGLMGRGLKAIPAVFHLGMAFLSSLKRLGKFQPDVVAGFGGYASFAPVCAAHFGKRPILLHEQNAIAGASNRFLGKWADCVCVSLPGTLGFSRECVVTGNPVRAEIIAAGLSRQKRERSGKRLLVLGGSQGAHALNRLICGILPALFSANVEILHQTGAKDYEETCRCYRAAGYPEECVKPFIDDMAGAYEWADLAFCRSGASTVAELCACGLAAVYVPFPQAIHDHQTLNAKTLAEAGAARLVPESELDEKATGQLLLDLLADRGTLESMGEAARMRAHKDAAGLLVDELEKISNSRN